MATWSTVKRLVRLSAIPDDELREVLTESWRRVAPKRLVKELDG